MKEIRGKYQEIWRKYVENIYSLYMGRRIWKNCDLSVENMKNIRRNMTEHGENMKKYAGNIKEYVENMKEIRKNMKNLWRNT